MSGRPDIHSLLKKIMRSTMTEYKKGANHCNEIQEEDLVKDLRDGILEFIILKIIYIYILRCLPCHNGLQTNF